MKEKAIICIDGSNFHYGSNKHGWKIDYINLLGYFKLSYDIINAFYYEGLPTNNSYFDIHPDHTGKDFYEALTKKKRFFRVLRNGGWNVKRKPVGRVFNEALSKFIHKCNFDVEITVDALDMISDYETFILGSGDGDFVKLVKYLKGKQKRVIVLSWGDRINSHLKKSASQLILLTEIKKSIEYLKGSEEQQSLGL